jgi:hypothetical protein
MESAPKPVTPDVPAKLRGRTARSDAWLALRLDGVIDEHNRLAEMATHLMSLGWRGHLVVDMGGVVRLNSVGVRDWVLALRLLRGHFASIQLIDCTPPVMNEVNFVRNFAEGATITTFQAPLFCTRCSREGVATVNVFDLKLANGTPTLPSFACDRSDCENTLDDDEGSYLAFLEAQQAPADPGASRRIAEAVRAAFTGGQGQAIVAAPPPSPPPRPPSALAAAAPSAPAASTAVSTTPPRQADIVFYVAVGAMVVVLSVLVYLIATLE